MSAISEEKRLEIFYIPFAFILIFIFLFWGKFLSPDRSFTKKTEIVFEQFRNTNKPMSLHRLLLKDQLMNEFRIETSIPFIFIGD